MFNGKKFSLKGNLAVTFLICLAISALIIILLSLIFALIANASGDPTGNLGLFSLTALIIGAAASGFVSAKIKKEGAVVFSALVALALSLIMLIICVIMSGKISLAAFMNYLCYIGVATLSAFVGSREKKHKRHRR